MHGSKWAINSARIVHTAQQQQAESVMLGKTAASSGMMIFISNTGRAQCNVTVSGLPSTLAPAKPAWLHRIDPQHGNPLKVWQQQGAPPFPDFSVRACLCAHESPLWHSLANR